MYPALLYSTPTLCFTAVEELKLTTKDLETLMEGLATAQLPNGQQSAAAKEAQLNKLKDILADIKTMENNNKHLTKDTPLTNAIEDLKVGKGLMQKLYSFLDSAHALPTFPQATRNRLPERFEELFTEMEQCSLACKEDGEKINTILMQVYAETGFEAGKDKTAMTEEKASEEVLAKQEEAKVALGLAMGHILKRMNEIYDLLIENLEAQQEGKEISERLKQEKKEKNAAQSLKRRIAKKICKSMLYATIAAGAVIEITVKLFWCSLIWSPVWITRLLKSGRVGTCGKFFYGIYGLFKVVKEDGDALEEAKKKKEEITKIGNEYAHVSRK
ncbi:hypothetical protein DdX_20145 [Ditylenchus destructor]|uniref:Uncharacterized protein n=1 Tax=Ditylenchus destructor TaxID=166010 RepID=A0AAD4MIH3_9BILA|nr:hypothetical protein DdX_20145 [Ditylenchus destructor]